MKLARQSNISNVKSIRSLRDAKNFLASTIAAEAERENTPLSEIERKMLYFSETGRTLPDMAEVSAEFDREYSQDEYERKIAGWCAGLRLDSERIASKKAMPGTRPFKSSVKATTIFLYC